MFCYCAQTRRLARTLTARYDAALAPAGITSNQFETMSVLKLIAPATGGALADQLGIDVSTLSRSLKTLIANGFIQARRNEQDTRQILYSLTAEGKRTLNKAMLLWKGAHDDSVERLGSHAAPAQRSLQRISQSLA